MLLSFRKFSLKLKFYQLIEVLSSVEAEKPKINNAQINI